MKKNYIEQLGALIGAAVGEAMCWDTLPKLWDALPGYGAYNVFCDALCMVRWGYLPKRKSEDYCMLIANVAETIEHCDEAMLVWRKDKAYTEALADVLEFADYIDYGDACELSVMHHYYLWFRLQCKVEHERSYCEDPDWYMINEYRNYERAVNRLIPETIGWDIKQWGDERNLFKLMSDKYGVGYATYGDEYDEVIKKHISAAAAIA